MKPPPRLILALLACSFCLAAPPPNVLLILADDVGSDAIGCYGGQSYPTTHIDALAADGLRFTHAFSMPVCHPSRICLMTGSYPVRFGKDGSRWGHFPAAAETTSIAQRLRSGGYATAIAGKWQLCLLKRDLQQPARLGFDHWCLYGWHEGARFHDPFLYQDGVLRTDTDGTYGPDLYVEFLVDFMRRSRAAEKPFFAYYSMALCHDVTDDLKNEHAAFATDDRWMTFAEMMSSMDDMVGRLMRALEEMDERENTLVIFTTDNGTAGKSYLRLNEKGKMVKYPVVSVRNGEVVPGGKGRFDDTGTRVPLIAHWPGRIDAGVSDAMVDLTDLLPTFEELAGVAPPDATRDGISFAPILFGEFREKPREWVYFELRGKRGVRSRDWKLYGDGRMFDLRADPQEQFPIPAPRSGEAGEQESALREVLETLQAN